jgi:cell division protein FtsB
MGNSTHEEEKGNLLIANKAGAINVTSAIVAILVVALVGVGSLIYTIYLPQIDQLTSQVTEQNLQIVDQEHQIADLNATINDLNNQVTNLQGNLSKYTAQLNTALGIKELVDNTTDAHYLYIRGTVTNNGVTEAYNAGLHVVGYGANHEVLIDMTSPVEGGTFQSGFTSSQTLSQLYPTQTVSTMLAIYHQGTVVDWDLTPVWTNSP